MKRRGINLKFLQDQDPGLVELLTSDLCHPETEEAEASELLEDHFDPELGDLADEIQEGLEDALEFLNEGLAACGVARGAGGASLPAPAPPDPAGDPARDRDAAAGESNAQSGNQLPLLFKP